ncbi:uncharacterized protein PGRI_011680 [Penicillium griseofulvum]|jgi:hypothetical protein|uniref:SnoaL-like domain-containing protein n=1 Tax=Penicillium patulum TaxID=5078 RepID=A0A135LE99_PENPA|nr:uncharacterized protein PGRI_011680 [Penicillium griseofulvum]KXG47298.1 hypothetical protein PGRI_011680 [Penicillium griseofulvum]
MADAAMAAYDRTMALPAVLTPALDTREAIADALHRFMLGMDTNDAELFDSAFTEDVKWDLFGRQMNSLKEVHTECFDKTIIHLDTTHYVTSVRINVAESGTEASLSCLYNAKHYRLGTGIDPKAPWFWTGGTYYLDIVKVESEGLWKIKFYKMRKMWIEGDFEVMGHGPKKD